eukprot:1597557-Pleurochrysis_carterae.AAC.1
MLLSSLGAHRRIVRWEGLYLGCNRMAMLLELVPSGDCQQLLEKRGPLPEHLVHPMILQLRDALKCDSQLRTHSSRSCTLEHDCSCVGASGLLCQHRP